MKTQPNIKILVSFIFMIIISIKIQSQVATDYNGNVYETVTIGNQIWMAENLRTTHYADGTPIEDGTEFDFYPYNVAMDASDSTKYFFYYDNDSTYAEEFGCLYNWFAAMNGTKDSYTNPSGIQGVCPSGWHIPSVLEWEELEDFVSDNSATQLLDGGSTGFNARFGGYRQDMENLFSGMNERGAYISAASDPDPAYTFLFTFTSDPTDVGFWSHRKTTGYSVRCIKNSSINTSINESLIPQIKIHPNPASDKVYINTKSREINNVTINTLTGKKIRFHNAGEKCIDVSDIESGLYLIIINIEDFSYIKKIIIE